MKRTLTTALTAIAALSMWAQSFTIHTTDGQEIGYSNDMVERIEFSLNPLDPGPTPPEVVDFRNFFMSMTPSEGVVDLSVTPTGLGRIVVTVNGNFHANEECVGMLTLSNSDGTVFERKASDDGVYVDSDVLSGKTEFTYVFDASGYTSPGNYVLEIPEGFYVDMNGKLLGGSRRVFVIERPAPAQTFTTTPSQGVIEQLQQIDFRFDEYRSVTVNSSARAFVYKEGSDATVASATPVATGDGGFSVTFAQPIATSGIYTVTIPGGAFTLRESDNGKAYTSTELKAVFEIEGAPLEEPKLGDFYYSDGTWSSTLVDRAGVEPIGVIFYIGVGPNDKEGFYKTKDGSKGLDEFHGYVVALRDATYFNDQHNTVQWRGGGFDGGDNGCGCSAQTSDFLGYTNSKSMRERADKDWGGLSADGDNLPAAYYAMDYFETQVPAPAQSSGWFLPSVGQLQYIWSNAYFAPNGNPDGPNVEKSLKQLTSKGGMTMYLPSSEYWSSTEQYDSSGKSYRAYYVSFDESSFSPGFTTWLNKSFDCRVRAILAF